MKSKLSLMWEICRVHVLDHGWILVADLTRQRLDISRVNYFWLICHTSSFSFHYWLYYFEPLYVVSNIVWVS